MSDAVEDEAELPDGIEPDGWQSGHPDGRVVAHGRIFDQDGQTVGIQMLGYLPPRNAITSHGDGTGQLIKLELPMSECFRSMYLQHWGRKHLLVTVEVLNDEQLAEYQEHQRGRGEEPAQVKGKAKRAQAQPQAQADGQSGAGDAAASGGPPGRRRIR